MRDLFTPRRDTNSPKDAPTIEADGRARLIRPQVALARRRYHRKLTLDAAKRSL
ncbi:hypothetical protein [Bradyrhizobium sp. 141]|uniref:hypothetical protein n=1 Tax=Bradyrhizobium sp. 141 TaxID=2782617 RepID=UPI001FF7B117|nr:hypothetical protein [Bradyrhizobium sp. 141]MCK1720928.1 hypothetical protein [Bradyrhizobium sp. 141]